MSARPADASHAGRPPAGKRRWLSLVKIAVALGLLAFVATRIPWSDRLVWKGPQRTVRIAGAIEGDWKQDSIRFRPTVAPARLPDALRSALDSGGALARSQELDWQPGLPRVFREVDPAGLVAALALLAAGVLVTSVRWWWLLGAAAVRARWSACLRLTSLGLFFNIVIPGLTGGDLIKAVLVARESPGQRAQAVISVAVDRLVGVFTLFVIGAPVILVAGGVFDRMRPYVLLALVAMVLGILVYTSRPLRRLVRFPSAPQRLREAVQSVDQAVMAYSGHKRVLLACFLASALNHLCVIAAVFVLGRAFGDTLLRFVQYVAMVTIANSASALPIAPGGWGVGEAAYSYLFEQLGSAATLGLAVSVSYRLCMMALGLLGGLFLLVPGARAEIAGIEAPERAHP